MNNIVCSYGCVATTDSQCAGTVRDLTCDELGKILRLLQKQSEDKKEKTMKCDNCDNQATMHKHYEKSDGTFADSYLCNDCFFSEYARCDTANICAWCGKDLTCETRCYDKQNRKYCDVDCMKRFMGYEYDF